MTRHNIMETASLKDYLDSLILHGIKLGLHNIKELMTVVGNPQLTYPVVHVAGTNGKGSVITFLNAMLRQAGYKTGRFTSPHLIEVNERFLINDVPISDEELFEHLDALRSAAKNASLTPTYFEMNTAIAFRSFAKNQVDIALVEVGMGGRFDATNIVEPDVCAITTIDYDHTQYLGETLEQIAFEKAGILKKDTLAVTGPIPESPMSIIEAQARRINTPVYHWGEEYQVSAGGDALRPLITYHGQAYELKAVPLGVSGFHQVDNAGIAITLAGLLKENFTKLDQASIIKGLQLARWPGRFEQVLDDPPVIMDVAHNPAGCRTIADAISDCVTIFSVSADKDVTQMLEILAPISNPLILTKYSGARALSISQLMVLAKKYPHEILPTLETSIDQGLLLASMHRPLLITGSIYAVGEARRILTEKYKARPLVF